MIRRMTIHQPPGGPSNMKHLFAALLVAVAAVPCMARDTEYKLPFSEVLTMGEGEGKAKLDPDVKLHFKGQPPLKVIERLGQGTSNKKTNGVGKDDKFGCQWAALSALIALQEDARRHGANAVIDIESYYKKDAMASATDYECHAGAVVIGVALRGSYAKVK
jgi:hypothetical protein